jgi:RNA polymerase-binding transcription factor DksA
MTDWTTSIDGEDAANLAPDEPSMEEQAMHVVGGPQPSAGNDFDPPDSAPLDAVLSRQHYLLPADAESGNDQHRRVWFAEPRGLAKVSDGWARERLGRQREWIVRLRVESSGSLGSMSQREEFGELTIAADHTADDASETNEVEVVRSMVASLDGDLEELDAALTRVASGRYGFCERCGNPIASERLDAVPATRYCVDDETLIEGSAAPGHLR